MMGWTHIVVSATATSLILGTANPAIVTLGAVSGLLPDVDISTSAAGRVLPWVSHWLERRFPHRSCTHSLFASGVIATVAYGTVLLSGGQFWQIAHAINIGYIFGWFIDTFTKSGVEIFWPSPVRCVCPGNRKFRLGSGSSAEYGLLIIVIALAIASFNINANGGLMTHFNRLIGSPTGVTEIYNKFGSTHLITAHIEGVRNINREPVSLDFTIIEARGQDFIVQSADGKIYKTGLDSSAQIIAEHITADVKKLAITNIEPLNLDDDPLGPTLLKKFNRPGAMVFITGQISIDDPEGVRYIAEPYQFPFIKLSASSLTLEVAPLSTVLTYFREQYATGQLQMRVIHEATTTGNT
ncbi:MAG: metal-dependent hydrolase [Rhizonema sp. PD37]|nr:metal-dependent hydrolase [Rhizonema sp. PD37]